MTSASLGAAKAAAASGDYQTAMRLAKEAEALANASIAQPSVKRLFGKSRKSTDLQNITGGNADPSTGFSETGGGGSAIVGLPRFGFAAESSAIYDLKPFGNARVLHMTDTTRNCFPFISENPTSISA